MHEGPARGFVQACKCVSPCVALKQLPSSLSTTEKQRMLMNVSLTQVALKQLPLSSSTTEWQRTQWMREVITTITTSMKCPQVVECIGFSALKTGAACLVMTQYEGGTLHDFIRGSK